MAVIFGTLEKVMTTVAYTGQVTFYKVPEKNHGHVELVTLLFYVLSLKMVSKNDLASQFLFNSKFYYNM